MPFLIHPHMLRHSCGFKYANEGKDTRSLQAYLGHRNIQSTVRYTAMAPDRFRGWERDDGSAVSRVSPGFAGVQGRSESREVI
jgi:integrase